jgi:hypothetical protein
LIAAASLTWQQDPARTRALLLTRPKIAHAAGECQKTRQNG